MANVARLRSSDIARRLAGGTAANLFDKLAVLLVQLGSIPVLTGHWGAGGYGIWLMLMTIPTYVALSDFGAGTAAGVDITAKIATADTKGALAAFQSVWSFISAISLGLGLLAAGYSASVWFSAPAEADVFEGRRLALATFMVALYAIALVQMSVLGVVYRSTHKYGLAIAFTGCLILIEGAALLATCLLGGTLVEAALALLIVRIVGGIGFYGLLRRLEPWMRLGHRHATISTVKRLANPSLAALCLSLASALALQGAVLTLGWVAGPASVAVFASVRLLTRIPLQLSGLVMRASIPELTRAQVAGNDRLTRRLVAINMASALAVTLPCALALMGLGPYLLRLVSREHLQAPTSLFVLLTLAATLNAIWQAAASPLIATNRQSLFAYWYVLACGAVVAVPLLPWPDRALATSVGSLLAEGITAAIVVVHLRNGMGARGPFALSRAARVGRDE